MGIIILSLGLAYAGGTVFGVAAFQAARRLRIGILTVNVAVIAGFVTVVALFIPIMIGVVAASTTMKIDMNPREGERCLSFIGLPANTTSDFCYRRSAVGVAVLADFQMAENDFLRWMQTQKWEAVPFELSTDEWLIPMNGGAVTMANSEVIPVRDYGSDTEVKLRRGYCYFWAMPDNRDYTIKIIYDLDTSRVYVELTDH